MIKLNYTYYRCEFCGKEFYREESAREHEYSHKKKIKIIVPGCNKYYERDRFINLTDCYNLNHNGFPDEIEVEDNFGNRACYQYDSIVKVNK